VRQLAAPGKTRRSRATAGSSSISLFKVGQCDALQIVHILQDDDAVKRKRVLMALDWYDHDLHRGIAAYARERDWVLNTHMARTHQVPEGWEGDGVIGLMERPATRAFVRSLNLPTVDIGGHFTEFPQVLSDNYRAGTLGAQHFLERNHTNLAFFFVQSSRLEKEVSAGFIQTVEATGKTCLLRHWNPTESEHEVNYRSVHNWAKKALLELPKPVGVMCQNDDTMAIILNAAEEAGLRIPEEIALLGLGNTALVCEFLPVKLSSIDVDLAGLSYRAAEELDRLFSGGSPQVVPVRFPPKHVVLRESTNFLAVSDPHVLVVLRKIWDHYAEPLNVEALIRSVPISRSSLYKLFIQQVGRPIAREVMRVRLDHAKRLLTTTDKSVGTIAKECGFSSLITFSRAFSENLKMSASEFRASQRTQGEHSSSPSAPERIDSSPPRKRKQDQPG
jgi:LacI family transcriptional regulator